MTEALLTPDKEVLELDEYGEVPDNTAEMLAIQLLLGKQIMETELAMHLGTMGVSGLIHLVEQSVDESVR
jgi:hypothetical protein